jgi:hypothetical protein
MYNGKHLLTFQRKCVVSISASKNFENSFWIFGPLWSLKMEETTSSKIPVPIYQMTWHHIPENLNLRNICCKSLKSHIS